MPRTIIKFYPEKKRAAGTSARGAPKDLGFPFNIYAMAESIDFQFGIQSLVAN